MSDELVRYQHRALAALITLNRPREANALSCALLSLDLHRFLNALPTIRRYDA